MVSIIIPTLNEEKYIAACLQSLSDTVCEVIVVDGGSSDNTVAIAESFGVKVVRLDIANRGRQMNTGAQLALGEILLFFHADSRLPREGITAIESAMENAEVMGGGFALDFFPYTKFYSLLAFGANLFCRITGMIFGDRGIFIRAMDFWRLGGFPEIAIMEDAALASAMRKSGKIVILKLPVLTSARKYAKETKLQAVYRTTWAYLAYRLGVPAETIKTGYYGFGRNRCL